MACKSTYGHLLQSDPYVNRRVNVDNFRRNRRRNLQRIGVCGRTASDKSLLMVDLFRISEIEDDEEYNSY